MKLSQIQMTGFKSFRNTTTIRFGDGITGVVGPNGCGKSNIVDAVLWVTGEGLASQLRGSQMEDVIFAGTSSCSPSAFAEVNLTFEKDEGEWPEHFQSSELIISRRLSRGGDSKYFINGEHCLLRDIQEIIMDTGAMGFSVVEQDTIARITTSKPEQLKALIEQVAGTAKFKNKKRLAQNKLKDTCQNMLRLEDVLKEHNKQLKRLERQAQQTHVYKELKEKITHVELYVLKTRYNEILNKLKAHTNLLRELSDQEGQSQKDLESLQTQSRDIRSQSEKKYSHLKKEREILRKQIEKVSQHEVKVEKLKSLIKSDADHLNEWQVRIVEYQSAIKHKSQEIEKLKSQADTYKNKISSLQIDFEKKTAQLEEKKLQYSLIQKAQKEGQSERDVQLRNKLKEEENLKNLKKELEMIVQNTKNLQKEYDERETVYTTLENMVSGFQKKVQSDKTLYEKLEKEVNSLKDSISEFIQRERQAYSEKIKTQEREQEKIKLLILESETCYVKFKEDFSALQISNTQEEEKYNKFLEAREKLKAGVDHIQLSLVSLQKDLKTCYYQIELLTKSIEELSKQVVSLSKKSSQNKERIEINQKELHKAEALLEEGRKSYEEQVKAGEVYEKDYQAQVSYYKDLENQISELGQTLNQISEQKHLSEVEKEALTVEKRNIEEKTLENYQTPLHGIQEEKPAPTEIKSLGSMKDQLSKIGQVNLLALSEYEELNKEHQDLQKQFDDLEVSKTELEQAIEEMDRISTKKFKKAYEEVNVRLAQVFQAVFGGGEASLSLVENEGVEILACPPGKKLKSLKLLSGGEKSLTALCVIFSLFLVRSAPFCVLDEVDAALDDSNVLRFNTLVVEMAERCQVILITHNKHSMKACHRLYGVTMEEKGITNLLSVEMKDYETTLSM
ncbi:MAG: AAA family ATPase [Bdellovibrionales bacterium]|nr:AAA family ATPase [Bdellovibrionales bacterium]